MLDLITVVFRDELPLLEIQARSISQYINSQDINTITIIVNDTDDVVDLIDTAWWQQNQNKVQIKPYTKWNYNCRINGWENQQICKLMGAAESVAEWSMVLDAKTWFIQSLDLDKLFDPTGRPCVGLQGISTHFISSQQFVEKYYNVALDQVIGPAGVPFMFHTKTVKDMVNSIDDFIDFFQTNVRYPNLVTEFHLYSGYVLSQYKTYDALYNKTQYYNCLNIADWEAGDFDQLFDQLSTLPTLLTASIHRRTYQSLTPEQIGQWARFLVDRKLDCDISNIVERLNTYIK
jgi:hypothetical protein